MEGADADKLDDKGLLQCLFGFTGLVFILLCIVKFSCYAFHFFLVITSSYPVFSGVFLSMHKHQYGMICRTAKKSMAKNEWGQR